MPSGDLAPYAGKWIAVRDGKIVASDIDADSLREHEEVRLDDAILPVAHKDRGYFIL